MLFADDDCCIRGHVIRIDFMVRRTACGDVMHNAHVLITLSIIFVFLVHGTNLK